MRTDETVRSRAVILPEPAIRAIIARVEGEPDAALSDARERLRETAAQWKPKK